MKFDGETDAGETRPVAFAAGVEHLRRDVRGLRKLHMLSARRLHGIAVGRPGQEPHVVPRSGERTADGEHRRDMPVEGNRTGKDG